MLLKSLREQIVETCLLMLENDLAYTSQGNISARDPETGYVAITPSAISYRKMKPEDINIVKPDGTVVEAKWKSTSETPLHLIFFRERSDVGAVVHAHAPYASVFAVANEPIPVVLTEAAAFVGGRVPVARYGRPGSEELASATFEGIGDGSAVLMLQHGLLCIGPDLNMAYETTLSVEMTARVLLLSRLLRANVSEVDADEVKLIRERVLKTYHPTAAE
jgi:L-ribulose-5-phosphate 4-epimerase